MDPIICVHDLCTAFATENGGLNVLENISFDIQEQEFVCILGPSGSGKSTLLKILAGLLPSTSGQVLYRGEVLKSPQRSIGFVFQKANLMPWRTVVENIALPLELGCASPECVETRAQEMVKFLGLQGFENSLQEIFRWDGAASSNWARSHPYPDVLLLDEPFGMLMLNS
jgi:NitT/TauT family transport system ATP-binding protein